MLLISPVGKYSMISVHFHAAAGKDAEIRKLPAGAFNAYGSVEATMKGGKRSSTMPRSGNRSQSFARR